MKREALKQLNRRANEMTLDEPQTVAEQGFGTVTTEKRRMGFWNP
jgi:hypothetical protein